MNTAVSYKQTKHRFRTNFQFAQPDLNVDASKGVIKNVSVCTAGEAEGHDVFLDQSFINDVVRLGNEYAQGVKCRFGHPMLSTEALGTYVGRFKNFRVVGTKAVADLYLDDVSKKSPGGDLYTWLLQMAQKNPDQFGISIVFIESGYYQVIDDERVAVEFDDEGDLNLIDPAQPLYISIESLLGADAVDEPAANADGLFSSSKFNMDKFAVRLTEFLDNNPDVWQFIDKNPEKFQPFLKKYNEYKKKVETKTKIMSSKKHTSFFQRLAAVLTGDEEKFAVIDAITDDGKNIRVDAAGDAPAPGDALYIVDTTTDTQTVAPDGDYNIAGGDFDGYKLTVVNGVITAVFNPNDSSTQIQQAAIKNYNQLQKENAIQKKHIEGLNKKFEDLQNEFTAFKKNPLAKHTNVVPDDDGTTGDSRDEQFFNKPWNKKAKRAS